MLCTATLLIVDDLPLARTSTSPTWTESGCPDLPGCLTWSKWMLLPSPAPPREQRWIRGRDPRLLVGFLPARELIEWKTNGPEEQPRPPSPPGVAVWGEDE
jgi:hypothetical protein